MALNRKDTPLANTPDPGKGSVTRTQVTNPNGSITYKMNWSNSGSSSSSKPVARTTAPASRVKSTPRESSRVSGSREITTMVPMEKQVEKTKMGGSLDLSRLTSKIETPSIEKRREEMRVKTYDKWKQEGESRSDYDARIKAATEKNAAKAKDRSRGSSLGSLINRPEGCGCH